MAKKNVRKPSGAAAITVIDDDLDDPTEALRHESNGNSATPRASASKSPRKSKPHVVQQAGEHFAVSDIKKAAAFANSIGGLDKAIAVLQLLKVAKQVQ